MSAKPHASLMGVRRLSDRIDTTVKYYLVRFTYVTLKSIISEKHMFWLSVILLSVAKVVNFYTDVLSRYRRIRSTSTHPSGDTRGVLANMWVLDEFVMIVTGILAQVVSSSLLQTCGVQSQTIHKIPVVRVIGAFVTLSGLLTVITIAPSNVLANAQLSQCIRLILYVYADTMQQLFEDNLQGLFNPILALLVIMAILNVIKKLSMQYFDKHFEYILQAMGMLKCNLVVAWLEGGRRADVVLVYVIFVIYFVDMASTLLQETDGVRDYLVFLSVNKIHQIMNDLVTESQWFWYGSVLLLFSINVCSDLIKIDTLVLEITMLVVAKEITSSMETRVEQQDGVNAIVTVFLFSGILQLIRMFVVLV